MGWKIGGALLALLAAAVVGIIATTPAEYLTGIEWAIALIFSALAAVFFWKGAKAGARKKEQRRAEADKAYMEDHELQQIEAGVLPSLVDVPVILGEGEVGHFCAPARRYITKKKSIGRTGSGGGVSVRVAKGVSLRTGGGASQTVYDDVTDVFGGLVILTNRRIVFMSKQNGFDCKLSSISAIAPEGGRVMIQAGSTVYRLTTAKQGHFVCALGMVVGK